MAPPYHGEGRLTIGQRGGSPEGLYESSSPVGIDRRDGEALLLFFLIALLLASLGLVIRAVLQGPASMTSVPPARRLDMVLALAGFGAALFTSASLIVLPIYTTVRVSESSDPSDGIGPVVEEAGQTLLEVNGPQVLVPLAVPVALAAAPLAFPYSRWRRVIQATAATLVSIFVVITGFSIGMAYLPSAVLLFAAAALKTRNPGAG